MKRFAFPKDNTISYGQDFGYHKGIPSYVVFEAVEPDFSEDQLKLIAPGFGKMDDYGNGAIYVKKADILPFEVKKCHYSHELTLVDRYPPHMQSDYKKRNSNIIAGFNLCDRCNGTGNELYTMYRKCKDCKGEGHE